jgi:predicted acyltransferase
MGELIRGWTIDNVIRIHLTGFLQSAFDVDALAADRYGPLIFTTGAGVIFWIICWWMYRQKIFIRI